MKLSTTTVGDGPHRAALLHGLSGDSGTWFEFAPWLASQGYTVTLVDQRGHGMSDRAASYLDGDLADDLVETLPVGLDLILGHSLGGRALLLAAERLRPSRAVYLDPGWQVPEDMVFALPLDTRGRILDAAWLGALLQGYSREHLHKSWEALQRFDPTWYEAPNPVLPDLDPPRPPAVPSLVVLADPSISVPTALQQRLRDDGYEVRVVPGGAHDLHIVNLHETKAALDGWL